MIIFSDIENDRVATAARAAVLFDGAPYDEDVEFPVKIGKGRSNSGTLILDGVTSLGSRSLRRVGSKPRSQIFEIDPPRFLSRAAAKRPLEPTATASGFAQWVYSLYADYAGKDEDRRNGLEIEQEVWHRRMEVAGSVNSDFLLANASSWELVHNGLHLRDKDTLTYFDIPVLSVSGKPLRASPDLVYRNRNNSDVIIIEIKYSRQFVPKNLWPNVWAQLWCYSKLPVAQQGETVTVIGEVWGDTRSVWREEVPWGPRAPREIFLRKSVRRNPYRPAFDQFFQSLFDIYSGRNHKI